VAALPTVSAFSPATSLFLACLTLETKTQFAAAYSMQEFLADEPRSRRIVRSATPADSQGSNSSQASAKRNGPRVAIRGFPVRCQGWLPGDEPALLQVVIDEVLQ